MLKTLKQIIPTLLVLTLLSSCDTVDTGPPEDERIESVDIIKPGTNARFEQGQDIPCKVETDPSNDEVFVRWFVGDNSYTCKNNILQIDGVLTPGWKEVEVKATWKRRTVSDKINIEIIGIYSAPEVEITMPQPLYSLRRGDEMFKGFVFAEGQNIYVKAKASDEDNDLNQGIQWIAVSENGKETVLAKTQASKETILEAKSSYKMIIAKVEDKQGLTGMDTLRVDVAEKIITFGGLVNGKYNAYYSRFMNDINPVGPKDAQNFIYPSLSTDGRYVTYSGPGSCGEYSIFIANYDFSSPKEVECKYKKFAGNPKFIQDDSKIVFYGRSEVPGELNPKGALFLSDVKSGNVERIPTRTCKRDGPGEPYKNTPCWQDIRSEGFTLTSDGQIISTIARITSPSTGHVSIVKIDPSTGEINTIFKDKDFSKDDKIIPIVADISPNEEWLAITATLPEDLTINRSRIAILKADGSSDKPIYLTPPAKEGRMDLEPGSPFFADNQTVCHGKEGDMGTIQCRNLEGNIEYTRNFPFLDVMGTETYPK